MYLTGMVEKRTLEKYEREAKEKNRETWYLSWALDTNLEGQFINILLEPYFERWLYKCRKRKRKDGGSWKSVF